MKFFFLFLAPVCLLAQNTGGFRPRFVESAIEFTTTSNASQMGVNFVVGYRFTVRTPVLLTALGAVLQGNSAQAVFGALPASMPVGLWDQARNLLVSATVSAANPLLGHFNYAPVTETQLLPGVTYTIAGLVGRGQSALSDVPSMVAGSQIVYGGARSVVSNTLVFPTGDGIARRNNLFGASFTYAAGTSPVAVSGRDRTAGTRSVVNLDGSASFSTRGGALGWKWALILKPAGSAAALSGADSATPSFIPDRAGVYVAQLTVHDGATNSRPSTVSVTVDSASAGGLR